MYDLAYIKRIIRLLIYASDCIKQPRWLIMHFPPNSVADDFVTMVIGAKT